MTINEMFQYVTYGVTAGIILKLTVSLINYVVTSLFGIIKKIFS